MTPQSSQAKTQLIFFTRYPEPGTTKTRLIPSLGDEGAALLQKRMSEQMITSLQALLATAMGNAGELHLSIYFNGGSQEVMHSWLGNYQFKQQEGNDLGEKMEHAFRQSFSNGATQAIIFGADIPGIDPPLLETAIQSLSKRQVVLGPCMDGGYYLLGFTHHDADTLYQPLFQDIQWSSESVYETTRQRVNELGLELTILPVLRDIDSPEDLQHVRELGLL